MVRIIKFFVFLFIVGCATKTPLSSLVTEAERNAVYEDLKVTRSKNKKMEERLNQIGQKLISAIPPNQSKGIEFRLGGTVAGINAYVNKHNQIYVTPAMMRFAVSDDELAAVLGHELGHAIKHHAPKRLTLGVASTGTAIAASIFADKYAPGTGSAAAMAANAVTFAPFSKEMELEADETGVSLMTKAGFNPEGALSYFRRMAIEMPDTQERSFAASHPSSPDRLVRLQTLIQETKVIDKP